MVKKNTWAKVTAVGMVAMFAVAGQVGAIGVDINAIQNSTNTNLNINNGSSNVNIDKNANGTSNLNLGSTGANGSVNTNINAGSNFLNLQSSTGATIQVDKTKGSLNMQVGSLNADAKAAIVSLDGGSAELIATDSDLTAYNQLVIEQRPGISEISVENGNVSVTYKQEAKLLGLFKSNLNATVHVDETGEVSIKLPWYSFLYTKNTTTVKNNVSASINTAKANNSVQFNATATEGNPQLRVQNNAKVVNMVSSGVTGSASLNVSK